MKKRISLSWLTLLLMMAATSVAHGIASPVIRDQHVSARVVTEAEAIQPGIPFRVGLLLEHDPHWHTYWKASATGYATSIQWDLPEGFIAGDIQWPVPKVYEFSGWIEFVYEGQVLLMTTITPPDEIDASAIRIGFYAEWLMCEDICIPGEAKGEFTVPVGETASLSQWAPSFESADFNLPKDSGPYRLEAWASDRAVNLRITGEPATHAYFFDAAGAFLSPENMDFLRLEDGSLQVRLELNDATPETPDRLVGVLAAQSGWPGLGNARAIAVDIPISVNAPVAQAIPVSKSLLSLVLLAFVGGLILNLMPCVFPVLGIKIMGFVNQGGSSKAHVIRHGLTFTAGVLVSFWMLAGALLVLRSGGSQLGWGFQLQSPLFVFVLTIFLFAFALNMSGLFEIGQSAVGVGSQLMQKSGYSGSFFSGVLATVVATPCAAPFLAPALGAALALPPIHSLLLFTAIAIGLSFPYLLFSAFPKLLAALPRPGPWMESFKQFMSFLLYATVAFLLWVLAAQLTDSAGYGAFALLKVLFGLVLMAMALWIYGRWAAFHKSRKSRLIATSASALLMLAAIGYAAPRTSLNTAGTATVEWADWEPGKAQQLADTGTIVYVDFTARWCVTCQTNKAAVFSSQEVLDWIERENVVLLKADWTNRDDRIGNELQRFQRSAVPFNLIYAPGIPEPIILPELLTPGIVLNALDRAKGL